PTGPPKDVEERVPEGFGFGILRSLVGPLTRERAGSVLDFVPAERHGFLPSGENTARRRNWHPGAGPKARKAWSPVLGGMARPATVRAPVSLTVGFLRLPNLRTALVVVAQIQAFPRLWKSMTGSRGQVMNFMIPGRLLRPVDTVVGHLRVPRLPHGFVRLIGSRAWSHKVRSAAAGSCPRATRATMSQCTRPRRKAD